MIGKGSRLGDHRGPIGPGSFPVFRFPFVARRCSPRFLGRGNSRLRADAGRSRAGYAAQCDGPPRAPRRLR